MRPRTIGSLVLVLLAAGAQATVVRAGERPARGAELEYAVVLSRHGVRSPTWTSERLNQYSTEDWPDWGVPPGHLTVHGRKLMELLGGYYRDYFTDAGLYSAQGCDDADRLYFRANTIQRTLETARALASTMLPACQVRVHSLPAGTVDPLFRPVGAGVGRPDRAVAVASIMGRLGSRPEALVEPHRPALETVQQVLLGCVPGPGCPAEGEPVAALLMDLPVSVEAGEGDKLADLGGSFGTASTMAQNFLLEYANGMPEAELGWGRVDRDNLRLMMGLRVAHADLAWRTPYLARASGSNLVSHVVKSIEQAVGRKKVRGALGAPGNRLLVIVGHDTNLANVAGMLGLSWLLEGYQQDDTPPGGALVFEVWRDLDTRECTVRTSYFAQTLEQMREARPLTLVSPPARAPVFVPGCSTAADGFPCSWKRFRRVLESAIDPSFVKH